MYKRQGVCADHVHGPRPVRYVDYHGTPRSVTISAARTNQLLATTEFFDEFALVPFRLLREAEASPAGRTQAG